MTSVVHAAFFTHGRRYLKHRKSAGHYIVGSCFIRETRCLFQDEDVDSVKARETNILNEWGLSITICFLRLVDMW